MAEQVGDGDQIAAAADEGGAKVRRPMCAVMVSSRPAVVAMVRKMVLTPRVVSWVPRRLSSSTGVVWAPGQSGRSSSQSCMSVRSWGWTGNSRSVGCREGSCHEVPSTLFLLVTF